MSLNISKQLHALLSHEADNLIEVRIFKTSSKRCESLNFLHHLKIGAKNTPLDDMNNTNHP